MYNQLYKFDVGQELKDYNLPFAHPEDLVPANNSKPLAASKVSSLYEPSEANSHEEVEPSEAESTKPNYTEIVK